MADKERVKTSAPTQRLVTLARWLRVEQARMQLQRVLGVAIVVSAISAFGCGQGSQLPRYSQTVDDMTIDLGVMPAELVQGHSTKMGDSKALHGGTPAYRASHHIVVALFDSTTGARITDARIRARVADRSDNHEPDRWLEPMQIDGTMTYGNFFLIQGAGEWRIHLEINRPGRSRPTEADFAYEHALDF